MQFFFVEVVWMRGEGQGSVWIAHGGWMGKEQGQTLKNRRWSRACLLNDKRGRGMIGQKGNEGRHEANQRWPSLPLYST